jgi:hypothetical protein
VHKNLLSNLYNNQQYTFWAILACLLLLLVMLLVMFCCNDSMLGEVGLSAQPQP